MCPSTHAAADDTPIARPIANNLIRLRTDDPEERLAISFAFAQV